MTATASLDPARAEAAPPVALKDAWKIFGGQAALAGVDFSVEQGVIHALVGENGAGKSTLIKLFAGIHQPDVGRVLVRGKEHAISTPRHATALGIGFLHQQFDLVPDLTVRENLMLTTRFPSGALGRIRWRAVERAARVALARAGVDVSPKALVSDLSTPQQQLVALSRVLIQDPEVIFLDEPTASLGEADSRHLLELLKEQRGHGKTIVYTSHRLEEVLELADKVTVLRDGRVVATVDRVGLTREQLVRMLGGVPDDDLDRSGREISHDVAARLEVRGLVGELGYAPVTLAVWPGEVLGIAGLVGSGRSRFVSMVSGRTPAIAGEILVDGAAVDVHNVRQAMRHGIVALPERRGDALVADFGIGENITLGHLRPYSWGGVVIRDKRVRAVARTFIARLSIKASKERDEIRLLSGGNQQKVLLARVLDLEPRALILDEPTAGIDIATKQFVYGLTRELAAAGLAVIFISSELEEVSLVADRIALWKGGIPVEELPRGTSRAGIVARLFAQRGKAATDEGS